MCGVYHINDETAREIEKFRRLMSDAAASIEERRQNKLKMHCGIVQRKKKADFKHFEQCHKTVPQ